MRAVEIARFHKKSTSTSRLQRRRRERWRNPSLQMRLGRCVKFGKLQNFVEKHHLNKVVAGQAMNLFNDNVMSLFHKVLKRRQKQVSLDSFLVKVERREKESIEPTAAIPLVIVKIVLHNNPPLSCLLHTRTKVFKVCEESSPPC
ncbi:uncharacterized protein LRATD2 isoform X1 [Felis catus]|uniref:uncharacterized protein LRATD2 isoform X1 n=1 Tax=Felis catus TaxID=9685 RepID=UPI001D1A19C8|nr:uncharacterized protein LRATD2 isoform X1 [Felis catus]